MRNILPDFPDIQLCVWTWGGDDLIRAEYVGSEADILAAGITTAEVLAKRPPRGPRPTRHDRDGDKIHLTRWNLVRDGVVLQRFKVQFKKSLAKAMKLPGFAAAWRQHQQQLAESEAEERKRAGQTDLSVAMRDPEFCEFLAIVQQLSPEGQRDILAHMRYLKNKDTRRLSLVVDNDRLH